MTKINRKRFIEACKESGGIRSVIAKRLKVTRGAITLFLQKNPELEKYIDEADQEINDLAESKLFQKIQEGNMRAIQFRLQTKAKDRGYVERQEIEQSGSISTEIKNLNDLYKKSMELKNEKKIR